MFEDKMKEVLKLLKKYPYYSGILILIFILFLILFTRERIFNSHEEKIFSFYEDNVFGIDISHYQGIISWDDLKYFPNGKEISFILIRASVGKNDEDKQFRINWKQAKQKGFVQGAYHYYRPDENSIEQANNFIKTVRLQKGDLPPILDIEKEASVQSMKKLKKGLKKWLIKVEKHYGLKPIIYTPDVYYRDFLNDTAFNDYPFWIANYNKVLKPQHHDKWIFWQFTQWGLVKGIHHKVDFNVFKGTLPELKKLTKK
ncbi:MAG: glycoside hydrolase family 25 protein [Bacteroidales bacterium]|nr:glycoside hydrolase family 25 protein [Bacteroidales bacterium]